MSAAGEAAAGAPKLKAGFSVAGELVVGAGGVAAPPNEKVDLGASAGLAAAGAELPKENGAFGASVAGAAAGAWAEPKLKAGFSVAGEFEVGAGGVAAPKEKAALGASAALAGAPKLKAGFSVAGASEVGAGGVGVPNENGALGASAAFSAGLPNTEPPAGGVVPVEGAPITKVDVTGFSGALGAIPKSKAAGPAAAGAGDAAFAPKKLGMPPSAAGVAAGAGEALLLPKKLGMPPSVTAGAEGLPIPRLDDLAGGAKKLEPVGLLAGVVLPVGVRLLAGAAALSEKMPLAASGSVGAGAGVSFLVWGESGSATMELAARGELARGRVEMPMRLIGARPAGTERLVAGWGAGAGAGAPMRDESVGAPLDAGMAFFSVPTPAPPKRGIEMPAKLVTGILADSSSSISGRSSSRAEKRPPPLGLVARELL